MTKIKNENRRKEAYKKLMKRKRIARKVAGSVAKRRRSEARFKAYGIFALAVSFIFLGVLLFSIFSKGYTAFTQTQIELSVTYSPELVEKENYRKIFKNAIYSQFPEADSRSEKRLLSYLFSKGAPYRIQQYYEDNEIALGQKINIWVPASSDVDMYMKGRISESTEESLRKLKDRQINWIKQLDEADSLKKSFNWDFFSSADSRDPELAGIAGAFMGSVFVVISCMLLALPLGILTAIYLEEFAPKNKITEIIEVNISNLAAVPSIVFGLLGLTIYLQFFGIPRSAPLAGGLTLALMALPVIVIATRTSIAAIPQSIRDGAAALGASKVQTTLHHVLPLAVPGIMTGTILSISRVLGETAPLLMIGMVAFVADIPDGFLSPATAMPVQVYLWSDSPEMGFIEKTSAAIMVLLALLISANALAIYLRKKFEIRW